MFHQIRQRLRDMRTIQHLCQGAQAHANARGESAPGAEHFLLAAIDLPDGSARRVFERMGVDPAAVPAAIEQQYRDALQGIGVEVPLAGAPTAVAPPPGLYRARPSGEELMQALAQSRKGRPGPLLGAHVLAVVASMPQGVAARALRAMRLDAGAFAAAALREAQERHAAHG